MLRSPEALTSRSGEVSHAQADARAFWLREPGHGEILGLTLPEPEPDDVPPTRAVLAGTVETAVDALWDAGPLLGDRIAVVGAGMVGCCVARLLSRFPAAQVTLVDVDAERADVAAALGVEFALPHEA